MTSFLTNLIARERQEVPLVQPRSLSRFEPAPTPDALGVYPSLAEPQSLMEVDVTAPGTPRPDPAAASLPPSTGSSPAQAFIAPAPLPSQSLLPDLAPVPPSPVPPPHLTPLRPMDLPVDSREPLSTPRPSPLVQRLNPVSPEPAATNVRPASQPPITPPIIPPAFPVPAVSYLEPRPPVRSPQTPPTPPVLTLYPPTAVDIPPPVTMLIKSEVVTRVEPLVTPPSPRQPPPPRQAEIEWPRSAAPPVDLPTPAPPTINVTIGRIEVRAQTSPRTISRPARPSAPVMDLEKYLELRSGGQL